MAAVQVASVVKHELPKEPATGTVASKTAAASAIIPRVLDTVSPPIHYTGLVGGTGGGPFDDHCGAATNQPVDWTRGSDLFVQSIQGWYNNDSIGMYGIQFTFWGGQQTPIRGEQAYNSSTFNLARDETITSCVLWGNGNGTRCGRIQLSTSKGNTWDIGKDTTGQTSYPQPVFGGYLLGGFGSSGLNVDNLGFVFLGQVSSATISNMTYAVPIAECGTIDNITLATTTYDNSGGASPLQWTFSKTLTEESSWSITQSATLTFGVSLTIKADIPVVGGTEASASFSLEEATSSTATNSSGDELTWSTVGTLQPGQKNTVSALTNSGTVSNLAYTADVEVVVDNVPWTYNESGVFKGVSYTQAWVTVAAA